jgi:hypothetical protein
MEPKVSVPCIQQLTTGVYCEPDKSNPLPHDPFLRKRVQFFVRAKNYVREDFNVCYNGQNNFVFIEAGSMSR